MSEYDKTLEHDSLGDCVARKPVWLKSIDGCCPLYEKKSGKHRTIVKH